MVDSRQEPCTFFFWRPTQRKIVSASSGQQLHRTLGIGLGSLANSAGFSLPRLGGGDFIGPIQTPSGDTQDLKHFLPGGLPLRLRTQKASTPRWWCQQESPNPLLRQSPMQLGQAGAFGSWSLGKTGLEVLSDGTFSFRPFTLDRARRETEEVRIGQQEARYVLYCTYQLYAKVLPVFLPRKVLVDPPLA